MFYVLKWYGWDCDTEADRMYNLSIDFRRPRVKRMLADRVQVDIATSSFLAIKNIPLVGVVIYLRFFVVHRN